MTPHNKPADWDVVDQASLDSFPASDPPAWGSSRAAPSASTAANPDSNMPMERSRRSRLALGLVAAGLTVGGLVLFFGTKLLRNR